MKPKTRETFISLLESLSAQENSLEYSRQLLCSHPDFEPYSVFQNLDRSHKGYLSVDDFHELLFQNGLTQTLDNCAKFVKQFDFDQDRTMVFAEFLKVILPTNNPSLRTIVSQRPTNSKKISFDVEFSISRLVNKEIEGLLALQVKKRNLLFSTPDFDLEEAFLEIDTTNCGFLNFDNLQAFFAENEIYFSSEQIVNLLKRLDRNDDGKASFDEFRFSLMPLEGSLSKKITQELKATHDLNYEKALERSLDADLEKERKNNYSEPRLKSSRKSNSKEKETEKNTENNFKRSKNNSPDFKRSKNNSPDPKYSSHSSRFPAAGTKKSSNEKSPISHKTLSQNDASHHCRLYAKPKKDFSQLYFKEQGELARTLKQFVLLDKEIDCAKRDLSIREDFEPPSLFKIMDYKAKGQLSAYEVEESLKKLDIFPSKYELFLVIKRFDREFEGKMSYSSFVEAMVPEELIYIVGKRVPMVEGEIEEFDQVLSTETLKLFKNLWILHLENEAAAEALRQRLASRKKFDLEKIFFAIDYDQDGFLDEIDLMKFIENHGIDFGKQEINMIIQRFDLNFDQRVSYSEFLQELTPKSPKKF